MTFFLIIENDDGLVVVEQDDAGAPEEAAVEHGGVLVDAGPYRSYGDAYDALLALQEEDENDIGDG